MPQKPYKDRYNKPKTTRYTKSDYLRWLDMPDMPPPPPKDPFGPDVYEASAIGEVEKQADEAVRSEWESKKGKGKGKGDVVLRKTSDGRRGMRTLLTLPENIATASVDPNAKVPFGGRLTYQAGYERVPSIIPEWLGGKSERVPVLNVDFMRSDEKGAAYKAFQKLSRIAEKSGRSIYSSSLVPQNSAKKSALARARNRLADIAKTELPPNASTYDLLLKDYPQLRYRDIPGFTTSGEYYAEILNQDPRMAVVDDGPRRLKGSFRSMKDLQNQINRIPKENLTYAGTQFDFSGIKTTPNSLARLNAARNLAKVGSVAMDAAGPAFYMVENAANAANPQNIRQFNQELAATDDLGARAVKGLLSPMTTISGLSLAVQEALGYRPMGEIPAQPVAKKEPRKLSRAELEMRTTGPRPKY